MTNSRYDELLLDETANQVVEWAISEATKITEPSKKSMCFLASTPHELRSALVDHARLALTKSNTIQREHQHEDVDLEIFEYCPGVALTDLVDTQANEERATDLRNRKGNSVLLIASPGVAFPSVESAFEIRSYRDLIRQTARVFYQRERGDDEVVRLLGLEKWLLDSDLERSDEGHSEGFAFLVTMAAFGAKRPQIGRELWRVGLIPDVGSQAQAGDFLTRLTRNREIVACLSTVSRGKRIADRMAAVKVGVTTTTRRVIAVLDDLVLASAAGVKGWCRQLLEGKTDDDFDAYGLTLDKWDLQSDTGDLESLVVVPFRDFSGRVRSITKLKQDPPNTHSESLYIEVGFDAAGDASKPPTVVVEWETTPSLLNMIGKWRVSLVRPKNIRGVDDEALVVKTVRPQLRKCSLRLEISLEDLPIDFSGKSILVAIEVAAVSDDDEMVMRLKSGAEAIAESDEFELRLVDAPPVTPVTSVGQDDAISPAAAILDVSVGLREAPLPYVYVLQPEKSLLEIRFLESQNDKAIPRAVRNIRVVRRLLDIQESLLRAPLDAAYVSVSINPDEPETDVCDFVALPNVSHQLSEARAEYFEAVIKASKTSKQQPLVETLEWEPEVCSALDRYLEIFKRELAEAKSFDLDQLLLLDTVQLKIVGVEATLQTTIVLPTHPLRSAWMRDYWKKLATWSQGVCAMSPDSRAAAVDIELVNRISLGNLPFLVQSELKEFHVYAEEIAFGYGLYVSPREPDHEALVSLTMDGLGSARSIALQQARLSALKKNFDNYVERRLHPNALAIATVNSGDGALVSSLVARYFQEETDTSAAQSDFRLEITAYSDGKLMRHPVRDLVNLQTRLRDINRYGLSHLSPLIGLSIRHRDMLPIDRHAVNLSVVQGIATGVIAQVPSPTPRKSHLDGLLTGTQTTADPDARSWHVVPTGCVEGDAPITELHRVLLEAQGRCLADSGLIGLSVNLTADTAADIRALHERSDRVLILDRYVGLDWFIRSRALGLGTSYILDYTPDFVEGLADRLIVTTQHPAEADRLIERVMREMGLDSGHRRTQVIENLNLVSGRLVLRLMTDTPQAHETVGLAVVTAYLRNQGELANSFIVPVDSHLEIFGGDASEARRRCDMLLVSFSEGSINLRCVEVKERRRLPISGQTRRRIQEQLNSTAATLDERYFEAADGRLDRELQYAHLASVLHHYIDRARDHDLLNPALVESYHRLADSVGQLKATITKEAFVVSMDSDSRNPENFDDITIQYLTAADLVLTSFSSSREVSRRSRLADREEQQDNGAGQTASDSYDQVRSEGIHDESADSAAFAGSQESDIAPSAAPHNVGDASLTPRILESPLQGASGVSVDSSSGVPSANINPASVTVVLGTDLAGNPVPWKLSTQGSPHALVIGTTGQGKSVTARHAIKSFSDQGLPSLVIDLHGDMAAAPPEGAAVLDVRADGLGFSPFYLSGHSVADISDSAFEIAEVFSFVCGLGNIQLANVFKAIKQVYGDLGWTNGQQGERLPTIEEFATKLEQVEKGARGRNARENLLPLTEFGLFQESEKRFTPRGAGRGLVVDLHNHRHAPVIEAAISLILRKVYREMFTWPQDSTMKLAVVLDEAHRVAKDPTLPRLFREGRKYGVACFAASQSISDFDDEVKNNAGAKVVFRTNFPESKEVAMWVRGNERVDLAVQIEQLRVGEAFVWTEDVSRARKCKMTGQTRQST